jgi:uroporphyrinogen-III synthase
LNTAIDRLLARDFDWAVFTTGTQLDHLLQLAEQRGLRDAVRNSLAGISIASIGPSTSEALEHHGLHPAFVASQPKMGMMIHELARRLNGGSAAGTE